MRDLETVLDTLRIASPCHADWDGMQRTAEDWKRLCGDCNKHVHDLRQMSRQDAELLLQRATVNNADGSVCVQIYRRRDGTVMTDDCPVGLRCIRDFWRRISGIAAGFMAFCGLWGCNWQDDSAYKGRVAADYEGLEHAPIKTDKSTGVRPAGQLSWRDQALKNSAIKASVEKFDALESGANEKGSNDNQKLELAKAALDVAKCGEKYNLYLFSKPYYAKAQYYATGVAGSRNLLKEIAAGRAKNAEKLGCK